MTGARLAGKTAIITGAGRGIGRAMGLTFGAEGANVVITDLDGDVAGEAAAEIESAGGHAMALHADAASAEDAERTLAATIERFGRVDVLVNNAGLPSQYREGDDLDRWDLGIDITLSAAFRQSRVVVPHMAANGGGALLIASSTSIALNGVISARGGKGGRKLSGTLGGGGGSGSASGRKSWRRSRYCLRDPGTGD